MTDGHATLERKTEPGTLRVLLVEDDYVDAKALVRQVDKGGLPYEVTVVETCAEARRALGTRRFDVVLLDYGLPDGTGLDLLSERCESGRPETPIVFVAGHGNEAVAVDAMRRGASDYLIKDLERRYLRLLPETVRRALQRRREEDERERLVLELQQALATIKTLRGLIPICADCRKMRDDKGYWQVLEVYLAENTDAKLTHGLCPDCVDKFNRE